MGYLGEFEQSILGALLELGDDAYDTSVEGRRGRPRKHYRLRPDGARALKDSHATIQAMAGGPIPKLDRLVEG